MFATGDLRFAYRIRGMSQKLMEVPGVDPVPQVLLVQSRGAILGHTPRLGQGLGCDPIMNSFWGRVWLLILTK
jgi:hypothetical protein